VPADWLDRHTSSAPAALRARVREHLGPADDRDPAPAQLAVAGRRALDRVLGRDGDRGVALDLLAADALVTLALLAQAQREPGGLGDFAAAVLHPGAPHA
jgi:hypothetical protein